MLNCFSHYSYSIELISKKFSSIVDDVDEYDLNDDDVPIMMMSMIPMWKSKNSLNELKKY